MQDAGDVGGRNDNAVRFGRRVDYGVKVVMVEPELVPFGFDNFGL